MNFFLVRLPLDRSVYTAEVRYEAITRALPCLVGVCPTCVPTGRAAPRQGRL